MTADVDSCNHPFLQRSLAHSIDLYSTNLLAYKLQLPFLHRQAFESVECCGVVVCLMPCMMSIWPGNCWSQLFATRQRFYACCDDRNTFGVLTFHMSLQQIMMSRSCPRISFAALGVVHAHAGNMHAQLMVSSADVVSEKLTHVRLRCCYCSHHATKHACFISPESSTFFCSGTTLWHRRKGLDFMFL